MEKNDFSSIIGTNEEILWCGCSASERFMDADNKGFLKTKFILIGILFLSSIAAYFILSSIKHVPILFSVILYLFVAFCIPAIVPFLDYRSLKKSMYALTNQRILVKGTDSVFSVDYEKIDETRILVSRNGNKSLCFGSKTFLTKEKDLRSAGCNGIFIKDRKNAENTVTFPVFYNIIDADKVKQIVDFILLST